MAAVVIASLAFGTLSWMFGLTTAQGTGEAIVPTEAALWTAVGD